MKKPCLAPYHPFKQKWYNYNFEYDHPNYCSSCNSHRKITESILAAAVLPRRTLYGDSIITISREDAHAFIDEVYDEKEKL